jgi:uncharacterized protein YjbI with pentapeptide repeats
MAGEVGVGRQNQAKKRALIISISQYDKLEPLEFCEKDGNKMYEVLKRLDYDIPLKYRLIGGKIDYNRVRDSILDFFSDPIIHHKDTILFYFSGHGVLGNDGEHYLSTSEIDPDKPRKRGLPFDELSKAREVCNSKTIFTILDCCYAGAHTSGTKGDEESANAAKKIIETKSKPLGEGKCILAASQAYQKAYEYKKEGHSFFTYYLAEALGKRECGDEDGDITPYKVNEYIDSELRSLPADERPKQTPLLDCRTAGKIILAHYSKEPGKKSGEDQVRESKQSYQELLLDGKVEEFNRKRKNEDLAPPYLPRINLSGKTLIGVDLHDANLTEAKLNNAKLIGANLIGAVLKNTDLSSANLRGSDLYGANLSGANLTEAILSGADLKGMINFSGANLTRADLRGVDLNGMVSFAGAILHDVDFSGSKTDKALIELAGANVSNVTGLYVTQKHNKYLDALKSFSEAINQQFKTYNISTDQVKQIEDSLKELVKEVEGIGDKEDLSTIKKVNIKTKIVLTMEQILRVLPKTPQTLNVFTSLEPFSKLIGKSLQEVQDEAARNIEIINSFIMPTSTDTSVTDYPLVLNDKLLKRLYLYGPSNADQKKKRSVPDYSLIVNDIDKLINEPSNADQKKKRSQNESISKPKFELNMSMVDNELLKQISEDSSNSFIMPTSTDTSVTDYPLVLNDKLLKRLYLYEPSNADQKKKRSVPDYSLIVNDIDKLINEPSNADQKKKRSQNESISKS